MLVISVFLVAGKTWVILIAALEFDRNDIQLGMPMHAAGLVVDRFAKDMDSINLNEFEGFRILFLSERIAGKQCQPYSDHEYLFHFIFQSNYQ